MNDMYYSKVPSIQKTGNNETTVILYIPRNLN